VRRAPVCVTTSLNPNDPYNVAVGGDEIYLSVEAFGPAA
jgi:hypothetical protein